MNKLSFKKGNLFNGIDGKIDSNIIDSSQYDLEIKNKDELSYYRIRFEESFYTASEITPDSFNASSYNNNTGIIEIADFRKTQYFKNKFPYYKEFNKEFYRRNPELESYYAFLQRVTGKNNINSAETLYRFSIPAIGNRQKIGVLNYELEIELARGRYYVVFYNEIMEEGYIQREKAQYMIYDKKTFNSKKEKIENKVLELAVNNDYPLNLLEYLYIMTNKDINLIAQFFYELPKFKSYEELLSSRYRSLIRPSKKENCELERELIRYFNGDQEDINYSFNNQSKVLRK